MKCDTLFVSISGGSGLFTYQWQYFSNSSFNYLDITGAVDSSFQPTSPIVGDNYYRLMVTDNQEGCDNIVSDGAYVKVFDLPSVIIGSDTSICFGDSLNLTSSNATTYIWSTAQTSDQITVFPNYDTLFWVIRTDLNNCKPRFNIYYRK